jgi:hypothetical protein
MSPERVMDGEIGGGDVILLQRPSALHVFEQGQTGNFAIEDTEEDGPVDAVV